MNQKLLVLLVIVFATFFTISSSANDRYPYTEPHKLCLVHNKLDAIVGVAQSCPRPDHNAQGDRITTNSSPTDAVHHGDDVDTDECYTYLIRDSNL